MSFIKRRRVVAGVAALCALAGSVGLASGASTNLYASVSAAGSQVGGHGVSAVQHLGPGRYEVTFNSDVSKCAYVATTHNGGGGALLVFTAGGHLGPNGVYVETKNQGGGLTDGAFDVAVDCGTPGMSYAVVDYNGLLNRGTAGTTVTPAGGGYNVKFPTAVKTCAFLANVADPGNGLVYNPAVVETSSTTDPNTVYVETKNMGGGLSSGIPFHLAVVCPSAGSTKQIVAAPTGIPNRANSGNASFSTGTGSYTLVTNRAVQGCAVIASRGQADTSVPYDPSTVETVPGPAANTIGVQIRDLAAFGGNLHNEAFHSAIIC